MGKGNSYVKSRRPVFDNSQTSGSRDIYISAPQKTKKPRDKKIYIIIGLAIVTIIVFVVSLVLKNNISNEKPSISTAYDPIYRYANFLTTGEENDNKSDTVMTLSDSKVYDMFFNKTKEEQVAYFDKAKALAEKIPELDYEIIKNFREETVGQITTLREFLNADIYNTFTILDSYEKGIALAEVQEQMISNYAALKNVNTEVAKSYVNSKMKQYENVRDIVMIYQTNNCVENSVNFIEGCLNEEQTARVEELYADNFSRDVTEYESMKTVLSDMYSSLRTIRNLAKDDSLQDNSFYEETTTPEAEKKGSN